MNRRPHRLAGFKPIAAARRAQRRARNEDAHAQQQPQQNARHGQGNPNVIPPNIPITDHSTNRDRNRTFNDYFNTIVSKFFSSFSNKQRKIDYSSADKDVNDDAPEPFVFRPGVRNDVNLHDDKLLTPMPRSGHRVVVDDDYLYVFGGFNSAIEESNVQPDIFRRTQPLFQELWRFSKLTRTWEHLPCTGEVPRTLVSASLIKLDANHLLAFGGSGYPFGEHNSNEIHICDLRTRPSVTWRKVEVVEEEEPEVDDDVSNVPMPGYGQGVVLDREGQCLYVCGGTDGRLYNCDVHRFDLRTRKWTALCGTRNPDMGRYRHELALYKGALYLIGGGTSRIELPFDVIDKFDLSTREWSQVRTAPGLSTSGRPSSVNGGRAATTTYPSGRISHAFTQAGPQIYILGGRSSISDFKDVWSLNLSTLRWKKHHSMTLSRPISFLSADATPDGELSIFGGVYNSLFQDRATRVNSVHQIWLTIPPLKRLAYLALCDALSQSGDYRQSRMPIALLKKKFHEMTIGQLAPLPEH